MPDVLSRYAFLTVCPGPDYPHVVAAVAVLREACRSAQGRGICTVSLQRRVEPEVHASDDACAYLCTDEGLTRLAAQRFVLNPRSAGRGRMLRMGILPSRRRPRTRKALVRSRLSAHINQKRLCIHAVSGRSSFSGWLCPEGNGDLGGPLHSSGLSLVQVALPSHERVQTRMVPFAACARPNILDFSGPCFRVRSDFRPDVHRPARSAPSNTCQLSLS